MAHRPAKLICLIVAGIAVFGDPSFTADQSFNAGTSTRNGIFSRPKGSDSLALLKTYASVLKSYCDDNDIVCASGLSDDVHFAEVPNHAQEAAAFIVSII
jgi:acetylxylan esterase